MSILYRGSERRKKERRAVAVNMSVEESIFVLALCAAAVDLFEYHLGGEVFFYKGFKKFETFICTAHDYFVWFKQQEKPQQEKP